MIIETKDCPICGRELEARHGDQDDPMYVLACPTPVVLPLHVEMNIKSEYHEESLSTHYEVRYQNHKAFNQMIRLWPFCVDSYNDVSNIFHYTVEGYLQFVLETPFLKLPLNDVEKTLRKIRTYVNFS